MENEIAQGIDKTPTLQPLKSSLIHNKSHTHSNLVFHPKLSTWVFSWRRHFPLTKYPHTPYKSRNSRYMYHKSFEISRNLKEKSAMILPLKLALCLLAPSTLPSILPSQISQLPFHFSLSLSIFSLLGLLGHVQSLGST